MSGTRGGKKRGAGKAKAAPWERQPGETDKAYAAFRIYLEAGPARSSEVVRREVGHGNRRQCEKWSSRWGWVKRVAAFEKEATTAVDEAHLDAIAQRAQRQAEIAQLHGEATRVVAFEILDRLASADTAVRERAKAELRGMSFVDLFRLEGTLARAHNRAVITERLALGMSTDNASPADSPRTVAEERARALSDAELEERLAPVDDLADRRRRKAGAA